MRIIKLKEQPMGKIMEAMQLTMLKSQEALAYFCRRDLPL